MGIGTLVTSTVILLLVVIVVLYYMRVDIYRFYRPSCPHCVKSQGEWNKFKKMTRFRMYNTVDINLDKATPKEAELVKKFDVKTVPAVIMYRHNTVVKFDGSRVAEEYMRWADAVSSN